MTLWRSAVFICHSSTFESNPTKFCPRQTNVVASHGRMSMVKSKETPASATGRPGTAKHNGCVMGTVPWSSCVFHRERPRRAFSAPCLAHCEAVRRAARFGQQWITKDTLSHFVTYQIVWRTLEPKKYVPLWKTVNNPWLGFTEMQHADDFCLALGDEPFTFQDPKSKQFTKLVDWFRKVGSTDYIM